MDMDTEICVCFDVTLRKLWHFVRRERPRVYSQLTECLGAGTGCGSCVPLLRVIAEHGADCELPELIRRLEELVAERDARRETRVKPKTEGN